MTTASFISSGNWPVDSEVLIRSTSAGNNVGRVSFSRPEGSGSLIDVLTGVAAMIFWSSAAFVGSKHDNTTGDGLSLS